ncbi:aldo/keto reductase, partial [bacterium]|nr:aldo/keto reductase [bacterium]
MHYRDLGRTGLRISEVGLGCNRLGEPIASDQEWDLLVKHSLDLGVNIFDTAEVYQKGRSEEVLGRVIPKDDRTIIATKYSPRQDD